MVIDRTEISVVSNQGSTDSNHFEAQARSTWVLHISSSAFSFSSCFSLLTSSEQIASSQSTSSFWNIKHHMKHVLRHKFTTRLKGLVFLFRLAFLIFNFAWIEPATHPSNFCNILASRKKGICLTVVKNKNRTLRDLLFFLFLFFPSTFSLRFLSPMSPSQKHITEACWLLNNGHFRLGVAIIRHCHFNGFLELFPSTWKTRVVHCFSPVKSWTWVHCRMLYNLGFFAELEVGPVLGIQPEALGHPKTPYFYSCFLQNWLWAKTVQCFGATTVLK